MLCQLNMCPKLHLHGFGGRGDLHPLWGRSGTVLRDQFVQRRGLLRGCYGGDGSDLRSRRKRLRQRRRWHLRGQQLHNLWRRDASLLRGPLYGTQYYLPAVRWNMEMCHLRRRG
jgi:hypothetical protein